jgi:recombination protein RecT
MTNNKLAQALQINKTTEMTPFQKLEAQILDQKQTIKDLLPPHITIDKFIRVIKTAVSQNMDLISADRTTLFQSCFKCAQDGLLPDGREASFVLFNSSKTVNGNKIWVKNVSYIPMLSGVLKLIRNSGELNSISTHVVYENDGFDYQLGDDEWIKHKPLLENRGKAICAYAIAKMKDGAIYRAIMSHSEIEQIRGGVKNSYVEYSIWTKHWGEMAKKTVIHRLAKMMPKATDIIDTIMSRDYPLFENRNTNAIENKQHLANNLLPDKPVDITHFSEETEDMVVPAEIIAQAEAMAQE